LADLLDDLRIIRAPNTLCWPNQGAANEFIDVYDWDLIVLQGSCRSAPLRFHLALCTGIFPCFIRIIGTDGAEIGLQDAGYLSCASGSGCDGIVLESLAITPRRSRERVAFPVIQISGSGASLAVHKCIFTGCYSSADGSCIQTFQKAVVNITSSTFHQSNTTGSGGAISSVGSQIFLKNCTFSQCHSEGGGGAIWASTFYLFGSLDVMDTEIFIDACFFELCATLGKGGGILASDTSNLQESIRIWTRSTAFVMCSSRVAGGAVSLNGNHIYATVLNSSFSGSLSSGNGGAISVEGRSHLTIFDAVFTSNTALGTGGGAIFVADSSLNLEFVICTRNAAPFGGGGFILHQGLSKVKIPKTRSKLKISAPIFKKEFFDKDYLSLAIVFLGQVFQDPEEVALNSDICAYGTGNYAVYGNCLASTYDHLDLNGIPTASAPANPGMSFTIQVIKLDVYNQTITSDSSSLLQMLTSFEMKFMNDPFVSISGDFISVLENGSAYLTVVLNPTFATIDFLEDTTVLQTRPYVYLTGIDALSISTTMQTDPAEINIATGSKVCPSGYILILDKSGKGSCSECAAGTYSLNPLAGISNSQPTCFACPPNGICKGGYSVELPLGIWEIVSGYYKLISCPAGYQLVNANGNGMFSRDIQTCHQCSSSQYILNSNLSNFTCQQCPKGKL
jgi:predicted outer membrane repeat protein